MGINNCKDRPLSNEYVEEVVCHERDLSENSMKVFNLGDEGKVLLVKQNGVISALGHKCSHYGAPLNNGVLGDGRIRCPWHGACFNIKNGDIEDFPGLDSIPCHEVEVGTDGCVTVRAKKSDLTSSKRLKEMSALDPSNAVTFVIVGGGPAGQVCAETLRQEGFTGRLILVTADKYHPYDRIKLSKQLNFTIEQIQLRSTDFYSEQGIELMLSTKAVKLDTKQKLLFLNNKEKLQYSSIFIATGSVPRRPPIPGSDLNNVFTLRNLADANKISDTLTPISQVVIYGTSFIGMEVAAYCVKKCTEHPGSVTVVGRGEVPFESSLGKEVGARIAKMFVENGVKFKLGTYIKCLEGDAGDQQSVKVVCLSDGTKLPADIVIFGLGSTFATKFLEESDVELNSNGSVPVNKFLETNCPGVFAGGDIAEAPVYAAGDLPRTIGHWGLAHYHGRIAALNMMSINTPLKAVPFFWTMLFGTSFRYAGHAICYDDVIIGGDIEALKFAYYYCKGDTVVAVTTVGTDPIAAKFAELLSNGKTLSKTDVRINPLTWEK